MSNEQGNWGGAAGQGQNGKGEQRAAEAASSVLLNLLGDPSMVGSQRDLPEVNLVFKAIEDHVEAMGKGSLTDTQRAIQPNITNLTKQISPNLPGFVLHIQAGHQVFVEPVLFSNSRLTNQLEDINLNEGPSSRTVSLQYTPVQYVNKDLIARIQEHFKSEYGVKGAREVVISNVRVIDLEQMATEEAQNGDLVTILRNNIIRSWEQGLTVLIAKQAANSGVKMPSPFGRSKTPYGPSNCAIARVEPITGQNTLEGIPTAANLQIRLQTTNGNNNGYNQEASKELVTANVNVTLYGNPIAAYQMPQGQNGMYPTFNMMGNNGRQPGYYPLIPVMIYDHVIPGEQMGDNTGLATYLFGLYATLAANSNYMFTEGLRSKAIGTRGNLATTEQIIKRVEGQAIVRGKEKILTEARLNDIDVVNAWIKENIAPHAAIATDIVSFGPNAAINNFLVGLNSKSPEFKRNTQTIVALLDVISNGRFSELAQQNAATNKGWFPGAPILEFSPIMVPVGTFNHDGKAVSLAEVDEIKLATLFPDDPTMATQYQMAIYGDNGQTSEKARQYKIRVLLNTFSSSRVNLNGFANRHYWSPAFLTILADALSTLGQLQSTGTMGTFRNDIQAYASGMNYITNAVAGQAGGFTTPGGAIGGNGTGLVFGVWG